MVALHTTARRFRGRTFGLLSALAIVGMPTPGPVVVSHIGADSGIVAAEETALAVVARQSRSNETPSPASTTEVVVGPVDVAPQGWRKTTRGWERTDNWANVVAANNGVLINDLIAKQQAAETSTLVGKTLTRSMELVRALNPITLLMIQIMLLAVLATIARQRESKITPSAGGTI